MKNLYTYILLGLLSIADCYAQVGINYTPFKDEVINSPFIIERKGNNQFRFLKSHSDASTHPKPNDVLISDADGNASWGPLTATKIDFVNGVFNGGITKDIDVNSNTRLVDYTNASITLPPGRWAVNFSLKFEILKDRYEQQDLIEYLTYTTTTKITQSTFLNSTFGVKTAKNDFININYDPNNDTYTTRDCNGWRWDPNRTCHYDIRRKEVTLNPNRWAPIDRDESIWARVILSDYSSSTTRDYVAQSTRDRSIPNLYLASGALVGVAQYTSVKGEIYIDNTTRNPKTYYLKVYLQTVNLKSTSIAKYRLVDFAAGPMKNGIDRFFAVPAGD